MEVQELIQLIRTCNLSQVRTELEKWKTTLPEEYRIMVMFYKRASGRKA